MYNKSHENPACLAHPRFGLVVGVSDPPVLGFLAFGGYQAGAAGTAVRPAITHSPGRFMAGDWAVMSGGGI